MLALKNLVVWSGGRRNPIMLIKDVSFDVAAGEVVALLGPNGSGKTTVLLAIAGFIPRAGTRPPSWVSGDESRRMTGRIFVEGLDVSSYPPGERQLGWVAQELLLYPHLSVFRNIAFGLEAAGLSRREVAERVEAIGKVFDLGSVMTRMPHEISGGQQQRVANARALVRRPRLVLYDEPTASFDSLAKRGYAPQLRALTRGFSGGALFVTHDPDEAMLVADRVVILNAGSVIETGRPDELYRFPETAFTAEFFSGFFCALIGTREGRRFRASGCEGYLRLPSQLEGTGTGTLMTRPGALVEAADDSDEVLFGRVVDVVYVRGVRLLRVRVGKAGEVLVAASDGKVGEAVRLAVKTPGETEVRWFDEV